MYNSRISRDLLSKEIYIQIRKYLSTKFSGKRPRNKIEYNGKIYKTSVCGRIQPISGLAFIKTFLIEDKYKIITMEEFVGRNGVPKSSNEVNIRRGPTTPYTGQRRGGEVIKKKFSYRNLIL